MKIISPRKQLHKRLTYAALAGVGLIALLIVMLRLPVPEVATEAGHTAARPLWSMGEGLRGAVFGAVAVLHSKEDLMAENTRLHAELSELRREAFAGKLLQAENRELRKLLGREVPEGGVLAAILARAPQTAYDTLIIDAGEEQGVSEGDLVVVGSGAAIGTVRKSLHSTATVVLFSTPGEETPVLLRTGTSTVPVTAEGRGGGTFSAHLPRDMAVATGTPVMLSFLEPMLFAEVEHVSARPSDSFQQVLFRTPVNVHELRFVKVMPQRAAEL